MDNSRIEAHFKGEAIKDLAVHTASSPWLECGGIVLGEVVSPDGIILVHRLSGPGPKAQRRFHSFRPDTDFTQKVLEDYWYKTQGLVTYLGDWHTHPWGPLSPSQTDLAAMKSISANPSFQTPSPISIIARPKIFWASEGAPFCCYLYVPEADELQRIDVRTI